MVSLAMAEPDRTEITDFNPAVSTTQPILTPKEIYQLLDDERWSKGVIEARRLLATEPSSGLAYLTLGDALSHYPDGDGDIYLAFEAWMTAKTLTPSRSSLNKVAQKRLAWSLERSGIVKLEPSEFMGVNGFGEGIRVEAFSHMDLDWSSRIEASRGSVYITNIPPGKIVLKITSDLGVYVTSIEVEAGSFSAISVATQTETVEADLESGEWLSYLESGRQAVDAMVQSTIVDPRVSFEDLANTMVQIPRAPVPIDSTTTFISPYNERIVYNNGARQTLVGGLYVLEVDKNGTKTYADIVVHSDLSVETIRQLVLNDELRRTQKESPIVREAMKDSQIVEPSSVAPKDLQIEPSNPNPEEQEAVTSTEVVVSDAGVKTEPDEVDSNEGEDEGEKVELEKVELEKVEVASIDKSQPTESVLEENTEQVESAPVSTNSEPQLETSDTDQDANTLMDNVQELETNTVEPEASFVWSPKSGAQVQRRSLYFVGGTALFTGYAMYRADRFADLANGETQSQASFEDYRSKSEQWRSHFGIASVVTGHVASLYLGMKVLEWRAVKKRPRTSLHQTDSNHLDVAGTLSEGEQ